MNQTSFLPYLGDIEPAMYQRRGSFHLGATITQQNDVVLFDADFGGDGLFYQYVGDASLPYEVAKNSAPDANWVSVGKAAAFERKVNTFTFKEGGVLTNPNDIIFDHATGERYNWNGALPKPVPAGSTPESTGGIGKGAWVSVGDASLRSDIKNGDGSLIGIGLGTLRDNIYYVTPEQFKSSMNDSEDWAIAINAALDYMESIGGGIVQLTPREYIQYTTIKVPENCTLRGSGMYSSRIVAHESMPAKLNSITSKNNPLYDTKSNGVTGLDYTMIKGVVVEDLMVFANVNARYEDSLMNLSNVQSCGIKLVSCIDSRISRCLVKDALLHCFDVAASNYFDDGDYTHNIDGGSYNVTIEDCVGINAMYDDIFTTHNSDRIIIKNCHASNDNSMPNMSWGNNQHGFEIDEGSTNVSVIDCVAVNVICGFQAKGHATTRPAHNIYFVRCRAKDCIWSFITEHPSRDKGIFTGITFEDCIAENTFIDRTKNYNSSININSSDDRARAMWLRGYIGTIVKNFKVIGGEGLIEIDGYNESCIIDGLKWSKGYSGIFSDTASGGLVNIISGKTFGKHTIKNIEVTDLVDISVIRMVDDNIAGVTVEKVKAKGTDKYPCLLISLSGSSDIKDIDCTGYYAKLTDPSVPGSGFPAQAKNYQNGTVFCIIDGIATIRGAADPTNATYPARVGNEYTNRTNGSKWFAKEKGEGVIGTWVKLSA